eukprot:SAG11_NODE_305_length_10996_cov_4.698082_7_plen_94_part_00
MCLVVHAPLWWSAVDSNITTIAAGHYYAYCKDFKTDKWYEFNDSTISALSDADLAKAYGGATRSVRPSLHVRLGAQLAVHVSTFPPIFDQKSP